VFTPQNKKKHIEKTMQIWWAKA